MSERQRDPEIAKKPAYIAYCRRCGGMTGCCADEPRHAKDVTKFITEAVQSDEIVKHETAADVWAATWCTCDQKKEQEQPSLFAKVQP